ncbi:MAG TPA: YHS domain-containing protein, partial [Thermoleophilaceae bacterium]
EECGEAIVRLLRDEREAAELAERGRSRARQHFLLPRLLLNEVSLMLELAGERPLRRAPLATGIRRDPVCGMALESAVDALEERVDGELYFFCSEGCRARFLREPQRYIAALGGVASPTSRPIEEGR